MTTHPTPLVTHARDNWWTLDFANAFVSPDVNSRGELVPSHGASRRRLGDKNIYKVSLYKAFCTEVKQTLLLDMSVWTCFVPLLSILTIRNSFLIIVRSKLIVKKLLKVSTAEIAPIIYQLVVENWTNTWQSICPKRFINVLRWKETNGYVYTLIMLRKRLQKQKLWKILVKV
jgi:hypothetical protein